MFSLNGKIVTGKSQKVENGIDGRKIAAGVKWYFPINTLHSIHVSKSRHQNVIDNENKVLKTSSCCGQFWFSWSFEIFMMKSWNGIKFLKASSSTIVFFYFYLFLLFWIVGLNKVVRKFWVESIIKMVIGKFFWPFNGSKPNFKPI